MRDKVKVETLRVGLHLGLDPGMCVCAGGHLQIKATVQNLAGVALGARHWQGLRCRDELLGTATAAVKQATLAPIEKGSACSRASTLSIPRPGQRSTNSDRR